MTSLKHFIQAIGSVVLAWGLLSCQPQSPKVSGTKDGYGEKTSGEQNQFSGDIPLFDTHSELFAYLLVDCDTKKESIDKSWEKGYGKDLSPQLSQKSAYYDCLYWTTTGSSNATHFCGYRTGCYAPPRSKDECIAQVKIMNTELKNSDFAQRNAEQVKNQSTPKKDGRTGAQGKSNSDTSQDATAITTPSSDPSEGSLPASIKPGPNGQASSPAERACAKMFPSASSTP